MLYRAKVAVYYDSRTKHTNALCGQKVEMWNAEPDYVEKPAGFEMLMQCMNAVFQWHGQSTYTVPSGV